MDVQGLQPVFALGLGSNLILNLPPDRSGQIGADFVNVAEGFGKAVLGMYQSQIASVQNVSGQTLVVSLDKNSSASMVRCLTAPILSSLVPHAWQPCVRWRLVAIEVPV